MKTKYRAAYDELCCYTLTHGDPAFIHQHVVDAFAVQNADATTKPITMTFALIALFLHLEKGFNGRQVQRAHQHLARVKRPWPSFELPHVRGAMTAVDVMTRAAGAERDKAIHEWCVAVWEDCVPADAEVVEIARCFYKEVARFGPG